jgi:hypothetical protein
MYYQFYNLEHANHSTIDAVWLIGSKSGYVGVEWHVDPQTVVSESYHYKNPTQRVGLEQNGPHHDLIEN